eukprot:364942-Chlamydomonas_euryale.AAC.24
MSQLQRDTEFLRRAGVMDYSILVSGWSWGASLGLVCRRALLMSQLQHDTDVLRRAGVTDYSMLVTGWSWGASLGWAVGGRCSCCSCSAAVCGAPASWTIPCWTAWRGGLCHVGIFEPFEGATKATKRRQGGKELPPLNCWIELNCWRIAVAPPAATHVGRNR